MTLLVASEVEQLTRLVASKTGETPDQIVREAIEARARAEGIPDVVPRRRFDEAKVRAIMARVAALPVLDNRSADEIIG